MLYEYIGVIGLAFALLACFFGAAAQKKTDKQLQELEAKINHAAKAQDRGSAALLQRIAALEKSVEYIKPRINDNAEKIGNLRRDIESMRGVIDAAMQQSELDALKTEEFQKLFDYNGNLGGER